MTPENCPLRFGTFEKRAPGNELVTRERVLFLMRVLKQKTCFLGRVVVLINACFGLNKGNVSNC